MSMWTCFSLPNNTNTAKYTNPSFNTSSASSESRKAFSNSKRLIVLSLPKYFLFNEQFSLVGMEMKGRFPNLSPVTTQNCCVVNWITLLPTMNLIPFTWETVFGSAFLSNKPWTIGEVPQSVGDDQNNSLQTFVAVAH
ncbi:hypothetical protein L3X38_008805 [Prunus dulcis]|uniref:Uncharacterized protein n=1 Tax=Prunus dulcis TaxID=3755 RepID=A0AAD5F7H3_PRUDU|nr:hypothetical protein L3X38_008805 [Prunus dulcis]